MPARSKVTAEHLRGPAIATLYERAGARHGHHVRGTDTGELACVEHLVTNCVGCGRTPGQHLEDAAAQRAKLDCARHRKRPACGCTLPRGAAID